MNIVHVIPGAGPGSFGGGPVVLNLVREQNLQSCNSSIWSLDTEEDRVWAAASSGLPAQFIRRFHASPPKVLMWSREMERTARLEAAKISVVHQHALWTGMSRVTSLLLVKNGIPSVITPHGSLEKWAVMKSHWKKKIALALYETNNLQNASCLHALSVQEVAGFRDFGLTNPIAVIPNGISRAWLTSEGSAAAFRSTFGVDPKKRIMLFLSRISPIKGLALLIEALAEECMNLTEWVLVIAGVDEFGHLREIREAINKYNLAPHVVFTGLLVDQAKRDAYAAADLFILPTKREAAPVVVLEALGAGVPVLTTKGAPWESLVTQQCGWWVDVDSSAIADALRHAMSCAPEELRRMGARGKELVAKKFSWEQSAQMTIELYQWLIGRGDRPDFVVVD